MRGLDLFRAHFAPHAGGFVLIGGAACHEWFAVRGLTFRATKDLDIVLIIEAIDAAFIADMRRFVADGGYVVKEHADGCPELYRFSRPQDPNYPYMLELFSRKPDTLDLRDDQTVVPIHATGSNASLSAILLDDAYYALLRAHSVVNAGIPVATATVLIPLKARAWLDLSQRRAEGGRVDQRDVDKHRTDVFRLAATLAGQAEPEVPDGVRADLLRFLSAFPEDATEWVGILVGLQVTFGRQTFTPRALRDAVRGFFRLDAAR